MSSFARNADDPIASIAVSVIAGVIAVIGILGIIWWGYALLILLVIIAGGVWRR